MLFLFIILFSIIIGFIWISRNPRLWTRKFSREIFKAYGIILLVLIPQIFSYFYFPLPFSFLHPLILTVGIGILALGILLLIWARITMGKYWGPPGQHDTNYQTRLITEGPFRYSRNPIYLGAFLLLFGFSLALQSIFFFLPIIHLLYFKKEVEKEEKLLKNRFGNGYELYYKKVKRFI